MQSASGYLYCTTVWMEWTSMRGRSKKKVRVSSIAHPVVDVYSSEGMAFYSTFCRATSPFPDSCDGVARTEATAHSKRKRHTEATVKIQCNIRTGKGGNRTPPITLRKYTVVSDKCNSREDLGSRFFAGSPDHSTIGRYSPLASFPQIDLP
jgi:hypothetical protein